MNIDRCIKTRRSIRKFLDKRISDEKIADILDSARYAPSAGNIQNWKFIIVRNKKTIEKLANLCADQVWVETATVLIVVCNDQSEVKRMYKKRAELFSTQNCAAAIQNILLKANSLGIASCWVGVYNGDRVKAELKVPVELKIDAIIPLGYAAREQEPVKRIDLENLVFFEEWGQKEKD
ncbi:nitroreductase family protein [archaeon]|nr:nitroreductase family protein [archaeon]